MNNTKKSTGLKTKKTSRISIGMLFLIFAATMTAVIAGLYLFAPREEQSEEPSKPSEISQPIEQTKPEEKEEVSDGKTPVQNEGNNPNSAHEITGSVISSNIVGYTLRIRTNIDQFISGTCTLNMKYVGEDTATLETEYTETVDVMDSASTSTCEGFDVNIAPLESGKYTFEIGIASNDNRTGIITGEVTLP